MPVLVPYALLRATYDSWTNREEIARRFWWTGVAYKADIVRVTYPDTQPNGLIHVTGVCYRLPGSDPGFRIDSNGTVIGVSPPAREAGLLEGDKLISLDGLSLDGGTDIKSTSSFRYHDKLLSLKPGTRFRSCVSDRLKAVSN